MTGADRLKGFIAQPPKPNPLLRLGVWISERVTGRPMLPARLLAWYPKAAIGSGVMESLVAHDEVGVDKRMLQLVRVSASVAAACPFCIDMNSFGYDLSGISDDELAAVVDLDRDPHTMTSLTEREALAVGYARLISATPLRFPPEFITHLTAAFSEREVVILASTAAQVNYWARLIQSLGIPPAGFRDDCAVPPR